MFSCDIYKIFLQNTFGRLLLTFVVNWSVNYAELVEFNYFKLIYYKVGAVFSINWGKYDKVGRYYQVWQAFLQRRSVLRYYKTGARAITKWGK